MTRIRGPMNVLSQQQPVRDQPVVHLACSRGGHFDLLLRHQEAFEGCRIVWVTQQSARAERLRRDGARVHVLGEWDRGKLLTTAAVAMWRSLGLVLRQRPRVVVTSGSGIVVPFCMMARLAGAKVVFVETSARVRGASSSGRVLSRVAHDVIAQWDEMEAVYPGATIARTTVVEELAIEPATEGAGSFVVVGTHSQPFDRLLRMVDDAVERGVLPEPVTAQVGPSRYRMRHADARELITPEEMDTGIAAARYVVCHSGTGTISTALRAGRRPLVLPRLARHEEHFDDHQRQLVDKAASLDLVVPLADEITASDLERASQPLHLPAELQRLPLLVDCLRESVQQALPPLGREGDSDRNLS
jgi:UDP-N-acetylglucosamine--N-acetylmuramyl-(pentapeptide) pyrophosphoryl-undecaprenol N-acetylglucosamine transferase